MDRRRFLHAFAAAAGAAMLAPHRLRAEVAVDSDSTRFAAALRRKPWLAGWQDAPAAGFAPTMATIEGHWPKALRGTFYRNGPARFERHGLRYRHWFDGDGMVHAWRCSGTTVEHRARFVATTKSRREAAAGRFLFPAAGTTVPGAVGIRNNDDINTANTAVIRFGGRVFALWEGGSAYELDPDDLQTRGPVAWREDLVAAPFSAHPLVDRDGSLWNFGSMDLLGGSGLLLWHIGADGKLLRTAVLASDHAGYLHAFAMTPRYLVFVLTPFRQEPAAGKAFFERLRFTPDQPCRIALVPKDALDAPRWFETEFAAIYHFADAWESGNAVHVRAVRHFDLDGMRSPMSAALRGETPAPPQHPAELATLRLDLSRGSAHWEGSGLRDVEFPVAAAASGAMAPGRVVVTARKAPLGTPWFNAVSVIDGERITTHRYGDDVMAEEHHFVPRPGARDPSDGWLLGTVLDAARARSGLAVIDARHAGDGPVAMAWLPGAVPLGFHGSFAPA